MCSAEKNKFSCCNSFGAVCIIVDAILGAFALRLGAINFQNAEEVCPWSPNLIFYLLVFGIVKLLPVLLVYMMNSSNLGDLEETKDLTPLTCFLGCLPILFLISSIGLTVWGFILLCSNPMSAAYDNHLLTKCDEQVYLVSQIMSWSSAVYLALIIIVISFFLGYNYRKNYENVGKQVIYL